MFVLFAVIAYLFYRIEYGMYEESAKHKMQMKAAKLSSQIIHAHMMKVPYSLEEAAKDSEYKIAFFDEHRQILASTLDRLVVLGRSHQMLDGHLILVDESTYGHLDVHYMVIEESAFAHQINSMRNKIMLSLLLVYILIAVVGYYLAKLFIRPIQQKRLQLDNFIKESTHELNTPISAMLMSIKPKEQMDQRSLDRIAISAKRVSDIYKDLTYLFLKDHSTETRAVKALNVIETLQNQVQYLKPLAEKKRLQIIEDYHDTIIYQMDEESLIRLLNNLLTNAIKYNRLDGKIEIMSKGNTLSIKDNGIGIEKEHQKEIYKRFYRGTKEGGGFGLGLNIVYQICRHYDIGIEMVSIEDEGTTFTLRFKN